MASTKEDIFVKWVQAYKGLFWKVARGFTANSTEQEDLIQEILLQLWIAVPNFKKQAKETTYIYRVAFNTAVVWDRKRKKHRKLKSVTLVTDPIDNKNDDSNKHIEQLYTAIRQLPKLDASLILMSLEGLSYKDIAETLGITESNVGVKLNRAKKQLSEKMKGLDNEL